MVYTKELLHREIEAYLQHINFAYNCYEAYNELHNVNEINNELLNISAGFFTITRFALSKCLLVETAKLFCGSGDERTIPKLINVAKSNNKIRLDNMYENYNIRPELLKSRQFYKNAFDTSVNYEDLMALKKELMR